MKGHSTAIAAGASSGVESAGAAARLGPLVAAIFLSSVGAVLFSLAIFRLLSFFIMPSMFFALLLVGFPMGAALASRRRVADVRRFRRVLGVLAVVMAASILLTLTARHFDHMRANLLFGVNPWRLLAQVLTFAILYLPFFVAYGAAEYVGYLAGTQAFGERMRPVYGVFLFGGATAFAAAAVLQQPLGVPRLLVLAIAAVAVSRWILAPRSVWSVGEVAVLGVGLIWPAFDEAFMSAFRSSAEVSGSVAALRADNPSATVYSGWGKYGYVDIVRLPPGLLIQRTPSGREVGRRRRETAIHVGYYNDIDMWQYQGGGRIPDAAEREPRDQIPAYFLPKGGSIAIIGSGGGREVAMARAAGAGRILAVEIEPRVMHMIQNELRDDFDRVYNDPPVDAVVAEARGYFERRAERFDVIMMISVGGYPQLMLEPGNMIRTQSAFALFASRLSERGVLVVGYSAQLDLEAVLLRQYYHTLREMGMEVHAYRRPDRQSYLLLAFPAQGSSAQKAAWAEGRRQLEHGRREQAVQPFSAAEMAMPDFRPITDDRPFLGGNIAEVLSLERITMMFLALAAIVGVIAWGVGIRMHRRLLRQPSAVSPGRYLVLGLLVGANFMLLEHLCVIQLFRHLYSYYDALVMGIVGFLTLTGLGSFLLPRKVLSGVTVVALLVSAVWWLGYERWSVAASVVQLVPLVMITGTFFPVIFEQVPEGRLELFAMDALGAALGALLAFFVPMLAGFRVFSVVALATFVLTGVSVVVFLRQTER